MSERAGLGAVYPCVKVAAVFAAPVMLDRSATVATVCRLIDAAADEGVEFIVFPESFVPGFPIWTALQRPIDGQAMFERFARSAMTVPGADLDRIRRRAAERRMFVFLGFCEAAVNNSGCLWNSSVLIGDDGALLNHHRKLMPTFYEKLVWAAGDGAGLRVSNTRIGRIGGLICGENNNMLARYTLAAEGEQIHAACFPSVWPFRNPLGAAEAGSFDISEAIRIRLAAHCFEAKVFSVVSAAWLDEASVDFLSRTAPEAAEIISASPRARSMVIGPSGELIAEGPTDREALVTAEIDLSSLLALKQHHDIAGYYNRFDVFRIELNRSRLSPIHDTVPLPPVPPQMEADRDGSPAQGD